MLNEELLLKELETSNLRVSQSDMARILGFGGGSRFSSSYPAEFRYEKQLSEFCEKRGLVYQLVNDSVYLFKMHIEDDYIEYLNVLRDNLRIGVRLNND